MALRKPTVYVLLVWAFVAQNLFRGPKLGLPVSEESSRSDTALIITTSWIPTAPSTEMIDEVVRSVDEYLIGLSSDAPLLIMVDHFPSPRFPQQREKLVESEEKHEQLDEFVTSLYTKYLSYSRRPVFVLPSINHWHIGGNVYKALNLITEHFPGTEYLYSLQHDFPFIRSVDHTGLVNIMKEESNVNYVRFRYKKVDASKCGKRILRNGKATISQSRKYSDNNHFVRLSWYKEMIISLGNRRRPPEFPMMAQAGRTKNCTNLGFYTYGGASKESPHLAHLDGRRTKSSSSLRNTSSITTDPVRVPLSRQAQVIEE